MTMQVKGGLRVHRVPTWEEGCLWIKNLWNWHSRDDHKSHKVIYGKAVHADSALLTKPSLVRRVAKELPGVGLVRSAEVAKKFSSVEQMINAGVKEWSSVPTLGKGTAAKIFQAIHGGSGANGSIRH